MSRLEPSPCKYGRPTFRRRLRRPAKPGPMHLIPEGHGEFHVAMEDCPCRPSLAWLDIGPAGLRGYIRSHRSHVERIRVPASLLESAP